MTKLVRDILIYVTVGFVSYILDVATAPDRYKQCWNAQSQMLLLRHHIFGVFQEFSWLSNQPLLLWLGLFSNLGILIHWYNNNNVCLWTQQLNEQCKVTGGMRSLYNLVGYKRDKYRRDQKIFILITTLIIAYKLCKVQK